MIVNSNISRKAIVTAIYLFAFLFVALYGNLGNRAVNQTILWVLGPLLAVYVLLPKIRQLPYVPIEYWLYFSLLLFSLIGFYKVTDDVGFFRYFQVVAANLVLMLIIFFAVNTEMEWLLIWKVIWLAGILITAVSFINEFPDMISDQNFRLSGIAGNANGTANYARVAILASLVLLNYNKNKAVHLMLLSGIVYLSYIILITASRGTFVNLLFILGGYITLRYLKGWRAVVIIIGLLLFGSFVFSQFESFIDDYYLYERLTRNDTLSGAIDSEARLLLYKKVWEVFIQHPIFGVGLNQFRLFADGKISHTDVLDILVQLGIFAGLCYIGIYIKLINRIRAVRATLQENGDRMKYWILVICLVSELFFGITNPNWFTQLQMVVLSLLIVKTHKISSSKADLQYDD